MTVSRKTPFDWRRSGIDWDAPPHESDSPSLVLIEEYLRENFGGCDLGIHWDRDTSNGSVSEHSWGSALDFGTGQAQIDWAASRGIPVGRAMTLDEHHALCDWLVNNSLELDIGSMVSIGRSWRSDRVDNGANGWKPYNSGYTGHVHIVINHDHFSDTTPIVQRLQPKGPIMSDLFDIDPVRIVDTRNWPGDPLPERQDHQFGYNDENIPSDAKAILATVTATDAESAGFAQAWKQGEPRPFTSVLNYSPDHAIANTTLIQVRNGDFMIRLSQPTHVIVDVIGYLI